MKWYRYVACFFAGVFLANWIPHFIHGVDGQRFATPFTTAPGKLDQPIVNTLWALLNIVVGVLLFKMGKISMQNKWTVVVFLCGFAAISLALTIAAPMVLMHYGATQ